MRWAERLGRFFALGWLVLLFPLLGAFAHGQLSAVQEGGLIAALAVYVAVYAHYCFWGYRRRSQSFVAVAVAVLTLLALAINRVSGLNLVNTFLIPLMVAGFGFRPRIALAAIAVLSAISLAVNLIGTPFSPQDTAALVFLLLPQLVLLGVGAMGLRYLLNILAELRAARSEIARLAVDEERSRISRDLHDLLGHSLSLITMKGELASRLIPAEQPGGGEVREMVGLSREALREVREVVSGYRQPTLATEITAARAALDAAGIRLNVEQSVGAVSRDIEAVMGWAVREGVTNVIRHSGATHCSIVLAREDGLVRADVLDDGTGNGKAVTGNGLRGLSERVEAIGGRLEADRLPVRGFRLSVYAPVSGSARS